MIGLLPRPGAEAELRRGQRAHRAQLDDVAGVMTLVRAPLERGDDTGRTTLARNELQVLGHLGAEARAAVAQDAALAVEGDQRRHRDRLVIDTLDLREARCSRTPAKGVVLQRALPALVADGAVERVVDEQELEHRLLRLARLVTHGRDDHAVAHAGRTRCLQLRHSLDLDEAHAARADGRPDARLVAEHGNLDADLSCGLDKAGASGDDNLATVDHQRDVSHRSHPRHPLQAPAV